MSLSDLASLGSFVSGVAIVVTLIFLLLQMRQSDRNQQSLIQQGRTARLLASILPRTEPHLSSALAHFYEDPHSLSPAELQAFRAWLDAMIWGLEDSFHQFRAGTMSATSWTAEETELRAILSLAHFRTEWTLVRSVAGAEFRDYVDNLVREIPVSKPGVGTGVALADWLARYEQVLAAG